MKYFINIIIGLILSQFIWASGVAVPKFPQIDSWTLDDNIKEYNASNLWDYIDGAADIYLLYDFINLRIGKYSNSDQQIYMEVYTHSSLDNAFGIYSAERSSNYNFQDIGTQGYYEPGVLVFFIDQYYVKLMAVNTREERTLLLDFADIFCETNQLDQIWPELLSAFPKTNRIENESRYINKSFLGYETLEGAFEVSYKNQDENYQIFIMKKKNRDIARTNLNDYLKMIGIDTKLIEKEIFTYEDPMNGPMMVGLKNNYIIGVYNYKNTEIVLETLNRLINYLD